MPLGPSWSGSAKFKFASPVRGIIARLSQIFSHHHQLLAAHAQAIEWTRRINDALQIVDKCRNEIESTVLEDFTRRHAAVQTSVSSLIDQIHQGSISAREARSRAKQIFTITLLLEQSAHNIRSDANNKKSFNMSHDSPRPKITHVVHDHEPIEHVPNKPSVASPNPDVLSRLTPNRTLANIYQRQESIITFNPWESQASFNHRLEEASRRALEVKPSKVTYMRYEQQLLK